MHTVAAPQMPSPSSIGLAPTGVVEARVGQVLAHLRAEGHAGPDVRVRSGPVLFHALRLGWRAAMTGPVPVRVAGQMYPVWLVLDTSVGEGEFWVDAGGEDVFCQARGLVPHAGATRSAVELLYTLVYAGMPATQAAREVCL